MRTIVKPLCGVGLLGLSLMAYFHLAWDPLCVNHNGPMIVCDFDEHCPPITRVDYVDGRCTRALTRWAVAHRGYPMWTWEDRGGKVVLETFVNRDGPYQMTAEIYNHTSNHTDLYKYGDLFVHYTDSKPTMCFVC